MINRLQNENENDDDNEDSMSRTENTHEHHLHNGRSQTVDPTRAALLSVIWSIFRVTLTNFNCVEEENVTSVEVRSERTEQKQSDTQHNRSKENRSNTSVEVIRERIQSKQSYTSHNKNKKTEAIQTGVS
jgi:hypothetical protein